jgi:hypothetical protein
MARIRSREDRQREERERVAAVARAVMEAEPAELSKVLVTVHVAPDGQQLPRIPIIGMEAGAVRGTIPHRSRAVRG